MADIPFPATRPVMYQTYTPFVEVYVKGVDILRSPSGKPRTLLSFSHDIYAGTGGFWTLEVFDPDYIALEELFTATAVRSTEVADVVVGESAEGSGADEDSTNIATVMFRYGYVGHTDEEKVIARSPQGEDFFYGTVHAYVPVYQTNGTVLTLRGDSAGTRIMEMPQEYTAYDGMTLFQIVQAVCQEREWILMPYGTEGDREHSLEDIPIAFKKCDDGVTGTEEKNASQRMREGEDPLNFLNRMCMYARTANPDANNFTCRLEYRAKGKKFGSHGMVPEDVKGYLWFGPETYQDNHVVRQYTYMRDAKSDIISFQPNVQVWVAKLSGAAGMTYKVDDAATGELKMQTLDEVNRSMRTDQGTRSPISFTLPEMAVFQEGILDEGTAKDKPEGSGSGPNKPVPPVAPKEDAPAMTFTAPGRDEREMDQQTMNYYLAMQNFVTAATLTIFGDPSPEIQPGKLISVWVYVPDNQAEDPFKMRIHWTSSVWLIVGVNHEIRPGEMITNLELTRSGWNRGGVTSQSAYRKLIETLSPGAQNLLS